MVPILDWIFEGIVNWISSIASQLLDAVSGLFLDALGTDMTAMEQYFPFVTKAYEIMQYSAWAILFLVCIWQLFRAFGGPITEAENPWHMVVRGGIYAVLIGYAKPIFSICLNIARAPYTSLMDVTMAAEDFSFAGIEQALTSGLTTLVASASVVGLILILILLIALGWNYFKLLLEVVERYIVVGVMCYTSPLAFSTGGSKATNNVFKSWCRMVGSQLLLLVMNVWFLRGFASSAGQFIGNGGALTTGKGSIFLWMFCALAYLKCAQRFDSYLASIGLNVAQTGSSMAMEMMMAARVISGVGSGARSAGSVFGRSGGGATATGTGAAATGFAAGFASRFNPNSYVRDAVVDGGSRMGFSGGAGFVGRAFGGMAARNGATLTGDSISSVASRAPGVSGMLDVFRPTIMQIPPPVVINIHGGGLVMGNKEFNTHFCMRMCMEGFLVFSVEYPLCPEVTVFQQLRDIFAAMNYIESVLPQYRAEPGSAFMVGDSAGAFLALYAAAVQRNPRLARTAGIQPSYLQIMGLGLISGMFFTTAFDSIGLLLGKAFYGKGFSKHPFYPYMDPRDPAVSMFLPPVLMVTSKKDNLRHYSTKLAKAIRTNGGSCMLNDYGDHPELCHAFSVVNPELIESRNVIRDIAIFFEDL